MQMSEHTENNAAIPDYKHDEASNVDNVWYTLFPDIGDHARRAQD